MPKFQMKSAVKRGIGNIRTIQKNLDGIARELKEKQERMLQWEKRHIINTMATLKRATTNLLTVLKRD